MVGLLGSRSYPRGRNHARRLEIGGLLVIGHRVGRLAGRKWSAIGVSAADAAMRSGAYTCGGKCTGCQWCRRPCGPRSNPSSWSPASRPWRPPRFAAQLPFVEHSTTGHLRSTSLTSSSLRLPGPVTWRRSAVAVGCVCGNTPYHSRGRENAPGTAHCRRAFHPC